LERHDLAALNRWRNDTEVIRHLVTNFHFIGPEVDARWYDAYLAGRDRAVRLAIVDTEYDRIVGCAYLTDVHRLNRSAEFSVFIGESDYWSRGYGTEAARTMLAHAFDDLNLHRVYLSVLTENARAVRLYERVGFAHEGRLREAVFKDGRYCDVLRMAILEPDYRRRNSRAQ
jgi:RimJ/RimL family protein N-acetyltransferase